ncbi:hypothetical protein AJ80_04663 [Polytolypa hystricis UAMH7299]|uniref:NOT2/NOT3/NOT5 C-terminal domain-containing protein n=1 Tax=Polytolypa hystricis (strain UAMH7299) TaxID=1447883 RepID=A0A2B7Y9G8_POLH7|nr:hypothetical protein AJ80_04663 [Polytolypa hystricis UAMH7299]
MKHILRPDGRALITRYRDAKLTLDLSSQSEFPSLSGGPQPSQPSTPSQAIWANASQRAAQQTVSQRQPQASGTSQPPSRVSQTQSHQSQPQSHATHDDLFPSASQFANQLDDFRNGGQGISGQLSGGQPQTGNIDEFPPLSRNVQSDIGQERRASILVQAGGAFGNYGGSGMGFSGISQSHAAQGRSLLGNSVNGQQDSSRIVSPGVTGSLSMSRSPLGQGQNGILSQEKEDGGTSSIPRGARPDSFSEQSGQQQIQGSQGRQQPPGTIGPDGQESSGAARSDQPPLSQMSDRDKYGLSGLLRMIHSESPDVASLAVGHDLMTLGLDLNHVEPLHPTFASPFINNNVSVPLQVDFTLPTCYNVANVQPLQTRIPSFSDETLFYIFYSMPRDIMQELVAEELMGRKWRYHKVERAWLTRDDAYPSPVEMERGVSERGVYLWWDTSTWKKVRREFILRYGDLDSHLDPGRNFMRGVGFSQST